MEAMQEETQSSYYKDKTVKKEEKTCMYYYALEDSDYDFDDPDNQLEDDFVIKAMGCERSSATGRKKGLLDEQFETLSLLRDMPT